MEAEFEREVLDRLIKIEEKLDGYNNAKVDSLEESNKWLFRTVVAAIITAAVGILFTLIRSGVGM